MNLPGAEVIKKLVGHDPLTAEKKSVSTGVPMKGDFDMIITCNAKLRVRLDGDSAAWRRRIGIVHCTAEPLERPTPRLAERIIVSEASGALNWMIRGAILYREELEAKGRLVLSESQSNRVGALLAYSDSVREFLRRRVEPLEGANVTGSELTAGYFKFCEEMAWQPIQGKRVTSLVPDLMLELFHTGMRNDIKRQDGEGKSKSQRGYAGVRLLAADIPEPAKGEPSEDEEVPF